MTLRNSKDAKVPAPAAKPAKGEVLPADVELEGIMSEIEEGLREDELKKLWKRYGNLIIAAAVAVVLGVLGFQLWRQYDERSRAELAGQYDVAVAALTAGKFEDAAKSFAAISAKKGEGYAALARLGEAQTKLQQNDTTGAIAAYKALAEDTRADVVFRDLATVLRVMHALDRDDPKPLDTALQPLLKPGSPFYHSALELAALLAAKQNDAARAAQYVELIAGDPAAPQGVRDRARDLAGLFKPAQAEKPAPEAAKAEPAPPELQKE